MSMISSQYLSRFIILGVQVSYLS